MRQIVTSEDIERLFHPTRRDAQEMLPHLVRRLIMVSASDAELKFLNMAAGDDIRAHGWDGIVEYSGQSAFVPTGRSVWEMGVSESPKDKANGDYSKRTSTPGSIDPKSTTFVFVTSRVWPDRQVWIDEHKEEDVWADVRVIDATVIATWLERAPVIATWVSSQLGRPIDGLETLDTAWRKRVAMRYGDSITPGLIVGGRDTTAAQLAAWVRAPQGAIEVVAETSEEALLVVLAVCRTLGEDTSRTIGDRALVITNAAATAHLATMSTEQIGVLAEAELAEEYLSNALPNLRLIIPRQEESRPQSSTHSIKAGPMHRKAVEESLVALGSSRDKAYDTARETKGSLQALLWMIAQPERGVLDWASGRPAAELAPLVLAGRWIEAEHADHTVVATLAGRPYADVRQTLAEWNGPGKPLQRRGGSWDWKAWRFAWARLAPGQHADTLNRFYTAAQNVLFENDPALSLDKERRWMAGVFGKNRAHSGHLRRGLVGSLVMAALHTDVLPGNAQARVGGVVRDLLTTDDPATRWQTLQSDLPDLAEAAPDAFLDAVELLTQNQTAVKNLFEDAGMFGSCSHAGLLWGLERLAWSSDHLGRVVRLLAKLAVLDPGGRWSNRPARTLRMLFVPWHPSTWAPLAERIAALRLLFEENIAVAWKCGLSLLPKGHDVGDAFARPSWRTWGEERKQSTTVADYWAFQEVVVELLLRHANSAERWEQLVPLTPELLRTNKTLGDRVLDALLGFDAKSASDADLQRIYDEIDKVLTHHHNHSTADWALDHSRLERFQRACERFRPRKARFRHAMLFEGWPERRRPPGMSLNDHQKALDVERRDAVAEVLKDEGLDGMFEWAAQVARPDLIGHYLAGVGISEADQLRLMETAFKGSSQDMRSSPISRLGLGFSARRFRVDGTKWREWAQGHLKVLRAPEALAFFAESAEPTAEFWRYLSSQSHPAADGYWRSVRLVALDDLESYETAIARLLQVDRLFAAVDLCGMLLHSAKAESTKANYDTGRVRQVLQQVLEAPLTHPPKDEQPPVGDSHSAYEIDEILSYLEEQGAPQSQLARWELKWLPFIQDTRRGPSSLSWEIAADPSLFVELIVHVFKASGDSDKPATDPDEQTRLRAELGWMVLEAWRHVPGLEVGAQVRAENTIDNGLGPITPAVIGTVNSGALTAWITQARKLAAEKDRIEVADSRIGQILAYAPADADGLWPCEPVRAAIETTASTEIEQGLVTGVLSRRGTHFVGRDGVQEARLSAQFRAWCERIRVAQPRTGKVLRELAEYYERDSKNEVARGRVEEFDR